MAKHRSTFLERVHSVNTRRPTSFLYAVGHGEVLKLGYSVNPLKRVDTLQTGYPEKLTLYAVWPGSEADERTVHLAWDHRRMQGEWFRASEVLEALALPWARKEILRRLETWDAGKQITNRLIMAGLASQAEAGVLGDMLARLKGQTTVPEYDSLVTMSRLIRDAGGAKR